MRLLRELLHLKLVLFPSHLSNDTPLLLSQFPVIFKTDSLVFFKGIVADQMLPTFTREVQLEYAGPMDFLSTDVCGSSSLIPPFKSGSLLFNSSTLAIACSCDTTRSGAIAFLPRLLHALSSGANKASLCNTCLLNHPSMSTPHDSDSGEFLFLLDLKTAHASRLVVYFHYIDSRVAMFSTHLRFDD